MRFIALGFVLIFMSCQSTNDQQKIQAIKEVLFTQQDAWNKGDIEAYMAGYERSDSLRFASGGNVSFGWETTLERYKKGYPDKETMGQLTFSNLDVKLIGEHTALIFGKWELERKSDHPWGLFTLIFEYQDTGWKVVHDHTSSAKE